MKIARMATRAFQKLRSATLKTWSRLCADGTLSFGAGVELGRGVRIIVAEGGGMTIGPGTLIEPGCLIHVRRGRLALGANSFVGQHSVIVANELVEIGADAMIGENVTIRDANHRTDGAPYRLQGCAAEPVTIGANVWLAAGVKVLAGVHLGRDMVAGAGTVVTGSFADGTTIVGVPARAVQGADLIDRATVKQWELGRRQIPDDLIDEGARRSRAAFD
jgi:acetyltransferase-like isoleucine patch superfamily enzyme